MKPRLLLAVATLGLTLPAFAANWTLIVKDATRFVEIDQDSVLQSDPGTKVAWGRIRLSSEDADEAGYATVKALNRYDCRARSFFTIKRVYLDASSRVIREERVVEQRPIDVNPRSVDERLWRSVCKPPAARDLASMAKEAGRVAAAQRQPSVRHADMKDTPEDRAKAVQTADSPTHAEPAPTAEADTHVAPETADPGITHGQVVLPPKPRFSLPPRAPETQPVATAPAHALPEAPAHAKAAKPTAPAAHVVPSPKTDPVTPRVAKKTRAKTRRATPRVRPVKVAMKSPAVNPAIPPSIAAHKDIHWSYEGAGAPGKWGALNPAWKSCDNGKRQSPIDIRDGIGVDLAPIKFDYVPSYFRILDDGHTVKVRVGVSSRIQVMGRSFDLVEFHFHRPSEERIDGRGFDMVAHLVHKDMDGRLAVVAILIERGEEHPLVQTLWNNLPLEKHHDYAPGVSIDPSQLLPEGQTYYTYMGSLTTPPCSEDVLWMVMKQPVQLSPEQIAIFARLYPMNARPVQAPNDRLIKASR